MISDRTAFHGSAAPNAPAVTREVYRDGMARLAAAVSIVTSNGPAGLAGFTATAVTSVTDQPPTLLVCVNRLASAHATVMANSVLAVNVLAAHHAGLANLFGGRTPVEDRFSSATWLRGETGAPLLVDALVSFDCRIAAGHEVGTHTVLICTVTGIAGEHGPAGLAYFNRSYRSVGAEPGQI